MDHQEIARRKAERRQERLHRELEEALEAGQPVKFVGITGLGYPRSFYRLHWRISNKRWCAAENTIGSLDNYFSPAAALAWWKHRVREGETFEDGGVMVEGDAAAVCEYDVMPSRAALVRAMATIRRYVYPAAP